VSIIIGIGVGTGIGVTVGDGVGRLIHDSVLPLEAWPAGQNSQLVPL
jgi:hypothetical protein